MLPKEALVLHPGPVNRGVELSSRSSRISPEPGDGPGRLGRGRADGRSGALPARGGAGMIILDSGRVIDPANRIDGTRTVLIDGDRIREVREQPATPAESLVHQVVDCRAGGCCPVSSICTSTCGKPGEEGKETISTGARAAVAGGVTTVVAMPNTKPVCDSAALARFVAARGREAGFARVIPAARSPAARWAKSSPTWPAEGSGLRLRHRRRPSGDVGGRDAAGARIRARPRAAGDDPCRGPELSAGGRCTRAPWRRGSASPECPRRRKSPWAARLLLPR